MPKVIELFDEELDNACIELSEKITGHFDLVVGIAEGGRYIATQIAGKLHLPLLFIKKQRKLTEQKNKIKPFLPFLPKFILNSLRILEGYYYELRFKDEWKDASDDVRFISDDISLFNETIRSVLLVDDSIDSGATMKDCIRFLKKQCPHIQVKTAVLTQTFKKSLVEADYKIYDRTLIRYPWSSDARRQ